MHMANYLLSGISGLPTHQRLINCPPNQFYGPDTRITFLRFLLFSLLFPRIFLAITSILLVPIDFKSNLESHVKKKIKTLVARRKICLKGVD